MHHERASKRMKNLSKKFIKGQSGFTIVELLVVIVVIGILASITIVAYSGVTARANKSAMQASAANLAKKIEAYNAEKGEYPQYNTIGTITAQLANYTSSSLSGSGITINYTGVTSANGTNTLVVKLCGASAPTAGGTAAGGYQVFGWDYTATTPALSTSAIVSGGNTTACAATSTSGS